MKTETIGTEIKIEAGKGKLIDGYQKTIELGQNNDGKTVLANCHYTKEDKLVCVFIVEK